MKGDGSRQLKCILDHGEPLPQAKGTDHTVHGPQFDDKSGNRILFGKVVTGFEGVRDLADLGFFERYEVEVMTANMKDACCLDVPGIMKEVNKRAVLFKSTHTNEQDHRQNVERLVGMVNSLWNKLNEKQRMVDHLQETVGRGGKTFDKRFIAEIKNQSVFTHNSDTNSLNLVLKSRKDMLLPVCPIRPHNNPCATGVQVKVGYSHRMIKFVLFVSGCYKASCSHSQSENRSAFYAGVFLHMPNVFLCPTVEADSERFLDTYFVSTRVKVHQISQPQKEWYEQPTEDEYVDATNAEYEIDSVIHNGKGVYHYFSPGNYRRCVLRLYMFIQDSHLVMTLKTRVHLACILSKGPDRHDAHIYVSHSRTTLLDCLRKMKCLSDEYCALLTTAMNDTGKDANAY